jgi:hypothetical protein
MKNKISYTQLIKYLPYGFVLLLLLIYYIAIKNTLVLKAECSKLIKEKTLEQGAPTEILTLKNKLFEINQIIGNVGDENETDPLLEFISSQNKNNRSKLIDYQPSHFNKNKLFLVETRIAKFEGSYINLLKLLYNFEQNFKAGKVVSVSFETVQKLNNDRLGLTMTIYIQSILGNDKQIKSNTL